jgi:hypothetical protein
MSLITVSSPRSDQLRPASHRPNVLACAITLLAIRASLRVWGFGRTLRFVRRRVDGRRHLAAIDPFTIITSTLDAVTIAAALLPIRARCLEQALATCWLAGGRGAVPTLRIGVKPLNFEAHAWVEYMGEPVGEQSERLGELVAFPALPQ